MNLSEKELKDKLETIKQVFEEDEDLFQGDVDDNNLQESVELEFSEIAEAIEEIVEFKVRKALTRLSEEFDLRVDDAMRKVTEAFELVSNEVNFNKEDIMQKVTEAFELVSERIVNDKKAVMEAFGLVCERVEGERTFSLDEDYDTYKEDFSSYIHNKLSFLKEHVSYNKLEQIEELLNEHEFNSESEIDEFFDTLEYTCFKNTNEGVALNEGEVDDFVLACSKML